MYASIKIRLQNVEANFITNIHENNNDAMFNSPTLLEMNKNAKIHLAPPEFKIRLRWIYFKDSVKIVGLMEAWWK